MKVRTDRSTRRRTRAAVVMLGCALVIAAPAPTVATALSGSSGPHCRGVEIPTGLAAGTKPVYRIYGQLCTPQGGARGTIQVLVHGGTYSHTYWDFPGFHGRYQYSRFMNRAGIATLAIDLLGVGRSSHPPSAQVTITAEAYAVHVAIQAARHGVLGPSYPRVILVGHSLGTLTNDLEASTYHDEDGFIATGTSHGPGFTGLGSIFAKVRPALLDPETAPQVPAGDLGYLSTPGARPVFYRGGRVDPRVEREDENTRQPVAGGYAATLLPYLVDTSLLHTNRIRVPVLLVNGSNDAVFCKQGGGGATTECSSAAALKRSEARYYGRSADLATYVLAHSGHDINLVPDARRWYEVALRWCQQHGFLSHSELSTA
ncbi:MAG TPA: alpha/beta fold hydrolase [Mycobacteriales bacterium]|nr:alpha/beta fold hydrolase [Mycobacteriales bacterium]